MSGDVNVMVAPFADATDPQFGFGIGQSIARTLTAGSSGGLDVQVRGPGSLSSSSDEAAARKAMDESGAQILVHGNVSTEHGSLVVRPYLYLDPRWLVGVEEFAGVYRLDPIVAGSPGRGNPAAARVLVRKAVDAELTGLTDLAMGLSWFDANRMRRALTWLDRATRRAHGRFVPVAELFAGNALGKLGRLGAAEAAFRAAAAHRRGFRRARFGMVELRFHHSRGDCGRGANADGLRSVSSAFHRLARTPEARTLASQALRLRARLGQARADFCLSQAAVEDRWARAAVGFRTVLRVGEERPARFRAERAEAHGWLGFILLPGGPEAPGATAAYRQARHHFRIAQELADDAGRRRTFARMSAFVDRRLSPG